MISNLKERVEEILKLCEAANTTGQKGSVERNEADLKFHIALKALDRDAGPGCVVGRILKFGVSDSYARYIIFKLNKKTAKVVHIPYMDGYTSPVVNRDMEVDRIEVEDNIAWADLVNEMRNRSQAATHQVVMAPVEDNLPVVLQED